MKVMTSRVVDGKIAVETDLEEGTVVAVLAADDAGFRLTAGEEDELMTGLNAIRDGDFVDGRQLLEELRTSSER